MKTRMFIETIRDKPYWDYHSTTLSLFHRALYVPEPYQHGHGPEPGQQHVPGCCCAANMCGWSERTMQTGHGSW